MDVLKNRSSTSLLAISRMLAPIAVAGAALVGAAPAQAQTACVPVVGSVLGCGGGATPADPLAPITDPAPIPVAGPVAVTLADGTDTLDTVNIATVGAAADVTINALGNATINTIDHPGVLVNSGGAITGQVNAISTTGDGATGVLLRAVDGVIFTADDVISTIGDNAPGLDIHGSTVTVNGDIINTSGDNSNGVQLVSLDGPIDLDANAINTSGDNSTAALLQSAGAVNLNVGVLQTQGSRALGLDISTNPATCVILGNGGCDVTAAADQITTNGFGGIGALVTGTTGVTTINVDALQTGGDEAAGLDLAADPTVCATLGAGACDQNFTVGNLTTAGANSPGALVRAAGNITGSVDVLKTSGDDAFGLDLASDPDACVLLGKGNCGTSFNVGQLTTSGAGATGVLATVAGPTTGRIGILGTSGDNATGIDLVGDPTACVLLGSGACDVDLGADQVTTTGDGAAGVLINAPANILANIGLISTGGDNAPGLSIITDPAACLVLGPGSCGINATTGPVTTGGNGSPGVGVTGGDDPVTVTTGPVTTGGDDSPGVGVSGSGPITVTTGPVTTGGDNSPGVGVTGGDGPIMVSTGPVTTGGDNSPGVGVSGTGPITVSTGPVTTSGDDSPGVDVDGGDGPVVVDTTGGAITTSGSDSDGVDVTTADGDQTITTGAITTTGPGSSGIVATSTGCGTVDITATGPISSAQGTGIAASSNCRVSVTTLSGAPVTGRDAGIDVTSGTGATITIGDTVSSSAGPAINADGASAAVTITPTGTLDGYVDLTDSDDTLVNNGTFNATGNSAFGGGSDSFTNTGTLAVAPAATVATAVTFTGLETTANSGLIDLRNGHTGDSLTLPGSFVGSGNSTLGVDVAVSPTGSTADKLVIGGAATGSTTIAIDPLTSTPGVLVNDLVLVDAGAGSLADAFTLGGGAYTQGFVTYQLAFDAAGSNYALYGTPSTQAYEMVKASEGARQIFYRTDDAWSGHMRSIRDAGVGDDTGRHGSALWGQMFGSVDTSRSRQDVTAFGQATSVTLDNRQDFFGGQIGYDFGQVTNGKGVVFGLTGGYASSALTFRGTPDRFDYDAVNGGAYASANAGPVFIDVLGKYEHYWMRTVMPAAGVRQKLDGNSYGGKAEAGLRFGGDRFFAEPLVAAEYVRTDLDTLSSGPSSFDFDNADGLRGSAGLRVGSVLTSGTTRTRLYAGASAVHEFKGRDGVSLSNGGETLGFRNDRIGTYGHGVLGVNIASGNRVSGFIEASGDWSDDYKGGGGRAGINIRF